MFTPTFPPVVKIDPTVLLFPIAERVLLIYTTPEVIFVSIKFVVVTLTTVRVPPIKRSPVRFMFPAEMNSADNLVVDTVLNEPRVE